MIYGFSYGYILILIIVSHNFEHTEHEFSRYFLLSRVSLEKRREREREREREEKKKHKHHTRQFAYLNVE